MSTYSAEPYHMGEPQPWAMQQVIVAHSEALFGFGEWAMFVLMWTAFDFDAGLVARCPFCYDTGGVRGRINAAYGQSLDTTCDQCYGTTFEGGYRARIIRPSLWADDNPETQQTQRGVVAPNILSVETTHDFVLHQGDYIYRADATRWRVSTQGDTVLLRTGFEQPGNNDVGMTVAQVVQEEKDSIVWQIPPTPVEQVALLTRPVSQIIPPDLSAAEDIRGPLLVAP